MPGKPEESPSRQPEVAGDESLSIAHAQGRILVRPQKVGRANERSPRETMDRSPRARSGRMPGLQAICEECCISTFFPDGMPPLWEVEDRMRGRMVLGRSTPVVSMPPRTVEICMACDGYTIAGLFVREELDQTSNGPGPTS